MRYSRLCGATLAIVVTCSVATVVEGQGREGSSTRRAIDAVNTRYIDAYNAGDVATFAQVYAPDATLMPSNSPPIHGQPGIAQFWQGGWTMGIRNVKLTTTELTVQGKMASEVGQYEFDVQPKSGSASHDHGKYIVLWKRSPTGVWQWYRDIFNSDVAMATAAEKPHSPAMDRRVAGGAAAGDTVWVVANTVRAEKRNDYEGFVTRLWRAGLDYGAKQDPTVLATFQNTRVLYPNRMNRDSTYTYMFVMDPPITGAQYDIQKLLNRMLPPAQADAEYRIFTGSLADKAQSHQFWTMLQH
ncbi:MAG: hypothetical protein NVS4B3_03380 [Gemmatimonadaceae bacterium]